MDVKLVIDGKEYVFGEGGGGDPCSNCRCRQECDNDDGEAIEIVYKACSWLGHGFRVVDVIPACKPATLNYPCGSMGEEIEQ